MQLLPIAAGLVLIPHIAWMMMVAPWPWAHENPSLMEAASYCAAKNITTAHAGATECWPELPIHVDYYLATRRFGVADNSSDVPIVHTIGLGGAIFTAIRGRRAP